MRTNFALLFFLLVATLLVSSVAAVLGQANSAVASTNWSLTVDGAVKKPTTFSMADLTALPYVQTYGAIYCDTNFVIDGTWGGFLLQTLLDKAGGVINNATTLEFSAADGYTINVAVATVRRMMIAYELDGQPLNETLRLIPGPYPGGNWISQITRIKVSFATFFNIKPPPTPIPTTTKTPLPTVQPTQIPTPKPTPSPTTELPTPTVTLNPIITFTPIPTLTATEPTGQSIGNQQTQPPTLDTYKTDYTLPLIAGSIVAVTVLGLLLFKRARKQRRLASSFSFP